ncbi:MAG: Uma2 family endonuclease [Synechococcaceae cyanobacterium]|nr:Uma2 family endonuclease [Synechococcaceae cyanobacterium]
MTVAPPAEASTAPEAAHTALAPLLLPPNLRLTPEQFAVVCEANPDAVLELAADGLLITMTPTGGETGARNTALAFQLALWARAHDGWMLFDSSTGFRLPDGSVLSPDASVVRRERWQALSPEQRRGFPPLCPDLVIELASASDAGPRGAEALRRKMGLYQANGALLGWLLFPEQRAVEIWPAAPEPDLAVPPQRLENAMRLECGAVLPGLVLELEEIWQPS